MTTGPSEATRSVGRSRRPARFNPFSAEFRANPYAFYLALREEAPVHKTMGMWVLTRYADVAAVLRDRSFSAGLIPQLVRRQGERVSDGRDRLDKIERLGRKSLVFTDNPDHARLRGLVNRAFTAAAVTTLRPVVTGIVERLVRRAREAGGMDVIADLAAPLPIMVMSDWMALPADIRGHVGQWTHDVRFLLEPGLMNAQYFQRVGDVVEAFAAALSEVLARRRAHPGADLVSQLLGMRSASGDRLTDEELVFLCMMCFVAGNETTKSLIGNGLLALLQHPDQAAMLRSRPELAKGAVRETLRYDSPLQLTKRLATHEVDIGGKQVAEGDQLLLCLGAANRDPEVFPGPDDFDITRGTAMHLAFGHGMHGCLGGVLAELQAEVVFAHLYGKAGTLELLTDRLEWQDHSFIVRGLKSLPVSLAGGG